MVAVQITVIQQPKNQHGDTFCCNVHSQRQALKWTFLPTNVDRRSENVSTFLTCMRLVFKLYKNMAIFDADHCVVIHVMTIKNEEVSRQC